MSQTDVIVELSTLAATVALLAGVGCAHATIIKFWYGNTGSVETAIKAQCDAFNAAEIEHKIICVGQDSYEVLMENAIAAYRTKNALTL